MLEFFPYTIDKLKEFAPFIRKSNYLLSDFSCGTYFMWHKGAQLEFTVYNNTFIARYCYDDEVFFSFPFGEDVDGALAELFEYTKANNLQFAFCSVNEELLQHIKDKYSSVRAVSDRRWSDYLYSFDEMLEFGGRRFKGQRNHMNRFVKNYGMPDFRKITGQDIPKIKKMLEAYRAQHDMSDLEAREYAGTCKLLEEFDGLGMHGGVLYVDNTVAGFTIGEIVGNMLIIHIEKALTQYSGVYPTLFNSFVKYISENVNADLLYVNREDDSGDLGLRTSKQQYKPIRLMHKYSLTINSPVCKIEKIPTVEFDGGALTAIRESDKQTYFELSIDKENNKYWGYDYENSYAIGDIVADAFYEAQLSDYNLGTAISFAVRKQSKGKMIGETVIYHFTVNGFAEIGCRIATQHQGKGYGKKAFTATADFAQNVLGLKPVAKCYKQNISSRRMILSAGFTQTGQDEKFYYFER